MRFHPADPPVVSLTENGIVNVAVEPGVPVKLYGPVAVSLNDPALTVPFTVGESAKAGVPISGNRNPPMSSITSSKPLLERW